METERIGDQTAQIQKSNVFSERDNLFKQVGIKNKILSLSERNLFSVLIFFYMGLIFITAFIFSHPLILICLLLTLIIFAKVTRIESKLTWVGKMVAYIAIFMLIINVLLNPFGDHVLMVFWQPNKFLPEINITIENLVGSSINILRLTIVIYSFAIFNILVSNDDLLHILLKLRFPHKLIILITLSLKFFPLMTRDYEHLYEISRVNSRSEISSNKSKRNKINLRGELLLPLLTNSLERSIQVAQALDIRAFGYSKNRTHFLQFRANKWDLSTIFFITAQISCTIYFIIRKWGKYPIYPNYISNLISDKSGIIFLLFSLFNFLIIFSFARSKQPGRKSR